MITHNKTTIFKELYILQSLHFRKLTVDLIQIPKLVGREQIFS